MHTPSIKLCQTKEVYSCMLQTYISAHPPRHTHTLVLSSFMLLFITIITRLEEASKSQAAFRSLTPIIIVWVSGVYRAVTLEEAQQASPHSFAHSVGCKHSLFLSLFVFVSQVRTALIYFSSFLFSSLLVLFSCSLHSTHKFFFLRSFFFHSIRSLWWQLPPYFIIICPNFNLETSWPCSCGFKGKRLHLSI